MAEIKTKFELVNELKEVDEIKYVDYHFFSGLTYKNLMVSLNDGSFFKFFCMPGQCGTAIIWGLTGYMDNILSVCDKIGRIYGYTTLQLSMNHDGYQKTYEKHGYKVGYNFNNKRTENDITVYYKEL